MSEESEHTSKLNLVDSYFDSRRSDDEITDYFSQMMSDSNAYTNGDDRVGILNRTMNKREREGVNDLLKSGYDGSDYERNTKGYDIFGCIALDDELNGENHLCFKSCEDSNYKPEQYQDCDNAVYRLSKDGKLKHDNLVEYSQTVILIIPKEMKISGSIFDYFQDRGAEIVKIYIQKPNHCRTRFHRREKLTRKSDVFDNNHSGGAVLLLLIIIIFIIIILGVYFRYSR